MNFEFSFVGLVFLVMLFVPNIIWSKYQPIDYSSRTENRILVIFERIGQVLVVVFSLFCGNDFSWLLWIAVILMVLYEIYWVRYFKSGRTLKDMYGNFGFIPLPGATLPVVAFFFLGIASKNLFLIVSSVILGIGHIGIHLNHKKEI
ncbi:hypothetical protein [Methanobrevibacter sp.]|uniref:hypothetical protein n=1 Tax=Methanobrevibacter sp. TaxID=66852 RepID=UPI00387079BE